MPAPKNNKFWEARTKHGRDVLFTSEDILWEAAVEYFEWVEAHPLWENKVTQFQGVPVDMPSTIMRAMTIEGLCLFLDISTASWYGYCKKEDFLDITSRISDVIRDQKFSGAAAGLLNANIIARDLGLKERVETDIRVDITDLSEDELDRKLAQLNRAHKQSEQT